MIRGFNCIHLTSRNIGGRACGGVSVLVRDGIPYSEYKLYTTLQTKAVTISTSKTTGICSLSLPPSEYLNIVLLSRLIDQLPAPFVMCGDFNGHSMSWGCDKNNSWDIIDDFITGSNICLLNDGSQPQEHSQPLIFLCVLRTFLWRLILWLNQIHTVVIIFLLFKKLGFHFLLHYPVGI